MSCGSAEEREDGEDGEEEKEGQEGENWEEYSVSFMIREMYWPFAKRGLLAKAIAITLAQQGFTILKILQMIMKCYSIPCYCQ